MDRKHLAILIALALFFSGCLQAPAKLGCCLKKNATERQGCVLYNDSSDTITNLIDRTLNAGDGLPCNVTANFCNVSYSDSAEPYVIPICTESDILTCRQPDCLAMVCGDFKFKPPIAPGLSSDGDGVKTDVPADTEEEAAMQFYHSQCRFLPMDGNLKKIMKSSKSSLNVFRVGVGGSFDEYEQYRYSFPMSDKFCAVNPPREGQLRVDRYMNYLDPAQRIAWDPIDGITTNCMVDGAGILPPYDMDESLRASPTTGTIAGDSGSASFSYSTVTPDKSAYKFAHWGRLDYGELENNWGYYYLYSGFFSSFSAHKKIDNDYYKKWLSIAHASVIYGKSATAANTTRAEFECDISSTDCYSAICATTTYNRVVMLTAPDANGITQEVVTDCESYTDENMKTRIICYPTTNVVINGPNTAPGRTFAGVDARLAHVEGDGALRYYNVNNTACGIFDEKQLEKFVDWEYMGGWSYGGVWADKTCPNIMDNSLMTHGQLLESVGQITKTTDTPMTWFNYSDNTWHSQVSQSSYGPPAGGVLFFGKTDPQGEYNGKQVIGYGNVANGQADDLLVVKNCGMVEGADYDYIQVPSNPRDWGSLKNMFLGYFKLRFQGMKAISTEDSCGWTGCKLYDDAPTKACSYFYDFFFAGLPWVINMEKDVYPTQGSLYSGSILNNEIQQAMTKVNRFSETMVSSNIGDTCALRGLNSGYFNNPSRNSDDTNYYIWNEYYQPVYNLLFSEYIIVFYNEGDGMLGNCALDPATLMPKVRTFGWCEPCTTSTLAYQTVSIRDDGRYTPGSLANIENGGAVAATATQNLVCKGGSELQCANNLISDMNVYSLDDEDDFGGPRTYPEASVLKERLGNYMKSGVMPVLDMSSAENWEENPDGDMDEYDFQRLIGKMGAVVVIVDRVHDSDNASEKAQNISTRTALIRSRCYGCLTAFHVSGPSSNESLRERAHEVFTNNFGNKFTVDMVTYDYPISDHSGMLPAMGSDILAADPSANLTVNYSQIIANDIASYSQAVLETDNKPSILVGLTLDSDDAVFNTQEKQTALFGTILRSQDELIKSGLIGIIYSPARQPRFGPFVGPEVGVVDVDANNTGTKNTKFCALQNAMQLMTAAPPIAVYALTNSVNYTECVPCESLEKSQGGCTADALMCDDGILCTPPYGLSHSDVEGNFRCEGETIVDDPAGDRCPLCVDIPGTYTCTFSYSNGTIETRSGNMTDLQSDAYLDILAGIEKPEKCCLQDSYGQRYSYVKRSSESGINKPLAFSKTGDEEADCGLSTSIDSIKEAQSFCSIQIPVKDYDVVCTLSH